MCGEEFFVVLGVDGFDGIVEEFGIQAESDVEVLGFAFDIADRAEDVAEVGDQVFFKELRAEGGEAGCGQVFGVLEEGLHW